MALNVENLYRTYGPMVLRRCRSMLKEEEAALDAMQETFVQVLRRSDSLEDRCLASLLYTIANRVCLNVLRDRRRHPVVRDEDHLKQIDSGERLEERSVTGLFLDQLFAGQKASTRRIAEMHYLEGHTLRETAEAVGLSVSGVRKRLRTLRTACRAMEAAPLPDRAPTPA